ncbi:hypothetical protein QNH48_04065 [Neobacillus sp. YX16]|uniref:hypothetical protein n=1 Tax=Neobacillus sp. YX16 TaxID=3047874 RepID=UPI0024C41803|nr:hypothetical protein [Neobacillus sp. YX16]WHZ03849.1 hypothetical protein QNH48_04065 [Neobacillus sp. YX16]
MPDWSYHPLKRLLLDKMRPKTSREFIHTSMSTIASIPGGRKLIGFLGHMQPPQEFQKELNQIIFPSPIGLSGHIDPNLSGINAFQELGFGFIEIGPIVLKEPKAVKEPRMENSRFLFSEHQEKVPLKLVIKKLTSLNFKIPMFAKIDEQVNKNEWDIIVQHLTPFVDAFIITSDQINSCLNKSEVALERPIYVSISSKEVNETEIGELIEPACIGGIVVNAPRQSVDSYWHEAANTNECLTKTVKQVKDQNPELIVITSGGVETPEEACRLVHAGADLVLLTEGYVKAGPGLPKRIHERLLYEEVRSINKQNWYWSFLFGLSILIGGIIALYFALTSIILP